MLASEFKNAREKIENEFEIHAMKLISIKLGAIKRQMRSMTKILKLQRCELCELSK